MKVIHSTNLLEVKVYLMWVFKLFCKAHIKSKIHQNCTKCNKTLASIISYVQTHSVQQQTEALCRHFMPFPGSTTLKLCISHKEKTILQGRHATVRGPSLCECTQCDTTSYTCAVKNQCTTSSVLLLFLSFFSFFLHWLLKSRTHFKLSPQRF